MKTFYVLLATWLLPLTFSQPNIPPPQRPECTAGWQSTGLTYVPSITQCNDYSEANGVICNPQNPTTCTGRNPFCSTDSGGTHKCCSDMIQDSTEIEKLEPEQIKPICPGGAIAYRMPRVLFCDPTIVNICPFDYKCVEAVNGHLLPPDGRSLCCKTSTLYSFGSVFNEAKLSPRLVPNPPIAGIDYVDPLTTTETMQLYYDRPSKPGKLLDLEEPIADGGFIYKKIFRADPSINIENPLRPGPNKEFRKLWVVLVFKTVEPLTRLYISVTVDIHKNYRSASEFLRSETGRRLGTPVAGTYFYLTAE